MIDIRSIALKDIELFFVKHNEKAFRAKQVYEWLWKKSATSFDMMTNLSNNMREELKANYTINAISILSKDKSADGTIKYAFSLHDKEVIEGVLIPSESRVTACISSQAGCMLACKFCATGKMKYRRNLDSGEIFDQVAILQSECQKEFQQNLSNIVIMGMGEPLMNFDNVMFAIDKITSPDSLGISPRRITLSTVGIPDMIMKLADMNAKFNLAISLHFTDDAKRSEFIPHNKKHNIESLVNAIKYYYKKTENRITIEYLLLKDINDNISDVKALLAICKNFPCKINVIEYNKVEHLTFDKSSKEKMKFFVDYLESKNLVVNVRSSKGGDINAACGQLANKKTIRLSLD